MHEQNGQRSAVRPVWPRDHLKYTDEAYVLCTLAMQGPIPASPRWLSTRVQPRARDRRRPERRAAHQPLEWAAASIGRMRPCAVGLRDRWHGPMAMTPPRRAPHKCAPGQGGSPLESHNQSVWYPDECSRTRVAGHGCKQRHNREWRKRFRRHLSHLEHNA